MRTATKWGLIAASVALSPLAAVPAAAADAPETLLPGVALAEACEDDTAPPEEVNVERLGCIFNKWMPKKPRVPRDKDQVNTGYGEIIPKGVADMFDKVAYFGAPLGPEDVFADLGSGFGRVVMQAYLAHPVRKAVGVELLELRHQAAEGQLKRLREVIEASPELSKLSEGREVSLVHGSFLDTEPWKDATVVFTNAVLFEESLMYNLRKRFLETLLPGSLVFSFKMLPGCRTSDLHLVGNQDLSVSWQEADRGVKIWIYLRVAAQKFPMGTVLELPTTPKAVYPIREECVEEALKGGKAKSRGMARRLCSLQDPAELRQLTDARCAWKEMLWLGGLACLEPEQREAEVSQFLSEAPWETARDFSRGQADTTILHYAARFSESGAEVDQLIKARADPSWCSSDEKVTPLHVSTSTKAASALIAAGANISAINKWGHTPLIAAVQRKGGSADIVAVLLEGRANVHEPDLAKRTPLHMAAKRKDEERLQALRSGQQVAGSSEELSMDIVRVLLRAGADTTAHDLFDNVPQGYASSEEMKDLLAPRGATKHGDEL